MEESIEKITLTDVKNNYNAYYKPNNAYLVIVGDINPSEIEKLVTKLFKDWKQGDIAKIALSKPVNPSTTEINFIDMPNAVQSEISVINTIDLTLGDKDYYAALLANKILGGGGTARLFMNLREDKGYTYGSYSRVSQNRYVGRFKASASVRNAVTDSSIVEIKKEILKIRNEKVSPEELKNAKAEYVGNFVMDVQKPRTVARFALNIGRYNLPENFYENYLESINSVTLEEVQNAAKKYFKVDNARIFITGKATEVLGNLEKTAKEPIKFFDKKGNSTSKPEMNIAIPNGVTATSVINNYFKAIGGKEKTASIKSVMTVANAKVQNFEITLTTKSTAPNKSLILITGMGQTLSKQVFDGNQGYSEVQGQRKDLEGKELEEAKTSTYPFVDEAFKAGKVDRVEAVDGKKAYVIMHQESEIFYDIETGYKIKSVKTAKGPQGETKVPVLFSDYKEVNGVKFPHKTVVKNGPMTMEFITKEVKINEGVSDADFK